METSEGVIDARGDRDDLQDIDMGVYNLDLEEQRVLADQAAQDGGEFRVSENQVKNECSKIQMDRVIFPHQLRVLKSCFDN